MVIKIDQRIELDGNTLKCTSEYNGHKIELIGFPSGDIRTNIKTINAMLSEAKDKMNDYLTKRESVVSYGQWLKQNPYIVSDFTPKSKRIQPKIEKVIFNSPATIVFWSDGTKTVVKAMYEDYDREKGLAMAIAKKFLGNKGNYFDTFKKYIK